MSYVHWFGWFDWLHTMHTWDANTCICDVMYLQLFFCPSQVYNLQTQAMVTCHRTYMSNSNTSFIHFPFNNFRYFLTLFSKFFSSFLHSTCSLSVSRQYLALDGIYHPLGLQSQATRLVGSAPYVFYTRHRTGLSPSMVQDSTWIIPVKTPVTTPIDYNSLINQRF